MKIPPKLLVGILAAMIIVAVVAKDGRAATRCDLLQMCLSQKASKSSAHTGQQITFTVKVRNNLNNAVEGMTLRYSLPPQLVIVSSSILPRKSADNMMEWRLPPLQPGDSMSIKVVGKVLSYAPKRVHNTAWLYFNGLPWKKSVRGFNILDATIS